MKAYIVTIFIGFLFVAQTTQAQSRSSVSSAANFGTSASYAMDYTIGESLSGVIASSASYEVTTGFLEANEGGVVINRPPVMTEPSGLPLSGTEAGPVTVEITVTDDNAVASVSLFFRQGGVAGFTESDMPKASGDLYAATIDGDNMTSRGGEFYIIARDNDGVETRSPLVAGTYHPILVQIPSPGLQSSIQTGTRQSDYRLISSPFTLSNASSSSVLSSLGSYDDTMWRFWNLKENYFNFEGEEQYTELTSGANFTPGSAFFILSNVSGSEIQTGAATTISTVEPFTKQLHEGWNFLGNPFNFNIPISAISLSNQQTPNVQNFTGGWNPQTVIQPFQGYIVDAGSSDNVVLTINPDLSASKTSGKQEDELSETQPYPFISHAEWMIEIEARSDTYFDAHNFIGVSSRASRDEDFMDQPEPPQFGEFLSLYFPHDDWNSVHTQYETDFRPEFPEGDVWDMEVTGAPNASVELTFSGLDFLPADKSIHLLDTFTGLSQDLRLQNNFQLRLNNSQEPRALQLLVGPSEYVDDQVEQVSMLPQKVELDQNYPNPFNPTTSIRYGISEDMVVSLKVYNVLGQVVSVLVDNELKKQGYHISHWDAQSENGSEIPSGLYIYELHVAPAHSSQSTLAQTTLTRKMLLVK